jgi:DNA repair protein RadC
MKEFKYRSQTSYKTVVWRFRESDEITEEYKKASKIVINNPDDVYTNFRFLFDGALRERFIVLWLSTMNKVQGYEVITEGILNCCVVHPREVFRGAIVATAASVILVHNHPSENPQPSIEDKKITHQLVESGKIIDIKVYDHIIFCNKDYFSFAQQGLL